jgi:hypothetical protein
VSNDPSEFFGMAHDWPIAPQPPTVDWRARAEAAEAALATLLALCDSPPGRDATPAQVMAWTTAKERARALLSPEAP